MSSGDGIEEVNGGPSLRNMNSVPQAQNDAGHDPSEALLSTFGTVQHMSAAEQLDTVTHLSAIGYDSVACRAFISYDTRQEMAFLLELP
jgi:hypothetical protein